MGIAEFFILFMVSSVSFVLGAGLMCFLVIPKDSDKQKRKE